MICDPSKSEIGSLRIVAMMTKFMQLNFLPFLAIGLLRKVSAEVGDQLCYPGDNINDSKSFTLESGINIRVRLLISEVFSRGYVLIKGGYVYSFLIFLKKLQNF